MCIRDSCAPSAVSVIPKTVVPLPIIVPAATTAGVAAPSDAAIHATPTTTSTIPDVYKRQQ